jgi:hypothetical protein
VFCLGFKYKKRKGKGKRREGKGREGKGMEGKRGSKDVLSHVLAAAHS